MIQYTQKLSFLTFLIGLHFLISSPVVGDESTPLQNTSMKLESPVFHDKGFIPPQFTADGKNVSPPLAWKNLPKSTRSLALVCDDPDAPRGRWVHWILYNIPPTLDHIDEGGKNLTSAVLFGKNSFEKSSYTGPNPPFGAHHYHFTLYALDTVLNLRVLV